LVSPTSKCCSWSLCTRGNTPICCFFLEHQKRERHYNVYAIFIKNQFNNNWFLATIVLIYSFLFFLTDIFVQKNFSNHNQSWKYYSQSPIFWSVQKETNEYKTRLISLLHVNFISRNWNLCEWMPKNEFVKGVKFIFTFLQLSSIISRWFVFFAACCVSEEF
jgi:hypothetical protein